MKRTVGIKNSKAVPAQVSVKSIAPPRPISRPMDMEKTPVDTVKIVKKRSGMPVSSMLVAKNACDVSC